jgi:hypothetical protein
MIIVAGQVRILDLRQGAAVGGGLQKDPLCWFTGAANVEAGSSQVRLVTWLSHGGCNVSPHWSLYADTFLFEPINR